MGVSPAADPRSCGVRAHRRRPGPRLGVTWAHRGLGQKLHAITLAAYDKIIGLELDDLAIDGCIMKAPCGGDKAGPSPGDRRKGGLKRSVATDAGGVPLGIVSEGANRHDSPLLDPTITAAKEQVGALPEKPLVHLDSGYDGQPSRDVLTDHDMIGEIAKKGIPSPIQVGKRWVVERTHSWMNNFGKLRRCTDRDGAIVDFHLHLAAAFVTLRCLIQAARQTYRWDSRPTTDPCHPRDLAQPRRVRDRIDQGTPRVSASGRQRRWPEDRALNRPSNRCA